MINNSTECLTVRLTFRKWDGIRTCGSIGNVNVDFKAVNIKFGLSTRVVGTSNVPN